MSKDELENQEDVVEQTNQEEESTEVETKQPEVDVEDLQAQLKEANEKYLRVHADFENIKKRLEKEKYQAIEYASEKFAKDLLTPIDTLEMALASANSDADAQELIEKLKEGIELTIKSFATAFDKHGIELVETDNGFDPNMHDAIMQTPSEDHEDGEIVQVMQKGYAYKERLLRPAMVSICKK